MLTIINKVIVYHTDPSTGYHVVLTKNSNNLQGATVTIDANGNISWGSTVVIFIIVYTMVCVQITMPLILSH